MKGEIKIEGYAMKKFAKLPVILADIFDTVIGSVFVFSVGIAIFIIGNIAIGTEKIVQKIKSKRNQSANCYK